MMLTPNQVSINYFMNQLNIQLKVCCTCKELKLRSQFSNNKSNKKDGLAPQCKHCGSKYRKKDRGYGVSWGDDDVIKIKKESLQKRLIRWLRSQVRRLFKLNGGRKDKRTLKILGVESYEEALSRLLKTLPEGYTEQDWLDGKLVIDHKIPISWFDLTIMSQLLEAGNINNLQLLTKEQNSLKSNHYGDLDNGGIILREEWTIMRQVPTHSHIIPLLPIN